MKIIVIRAVYMGLALSGAESFSQNTFPSSGNVGIGTSTPASALHVKTSAHTYVTIDKGSSSHEGGLVFLTGGTTKFYLFSDDGDDALKIEASGGVIDTDAAPRMAFPFSNRNIYMAQSGGNVGIGTNDPKAKLHITGSGNPWTTSYWSKAISYWSKAIEVPTSSTIKWAANGNGQRFGLGQAEAGFYFVRGSVDDVSAYPTYDMFIANNGSVGIGTTSPDAKLTVNGHIHATEIKVTPTVPTPDYVFEKTYDLRSLAAVESYIDKNRHLPEIPSAPEIEKNGLQVGEMNMLLLKK